MELLGIWPPLPIVIKNEVGQPMPQKIMTSTLRSCNVTVYATLPPSSRQLSITTTGPSDAGAIPIAGKFPAYIFRSNPIVITAIPLRFFLAVS